MKSWHKLRVATALLSGAVLIGVLVAILVQNYAVPRDEQAHSRTQEQADQTVTTDGLLADAPITSDTPAEDVVAEKSDAPKPEAKPAPNEAVPDIKPATYSYTAVAGDSYTTLARQAIAEYAEKHDKALSDTEALLAEIALANAAGSPALDVGDTVELAASDVAKVLPAETKAAETPDPAPIPAEKTKPQASTDYNYTVAAGDSYTTLARDAVAKYIERENRTLTAEQRVYAESQLAIAAGSPVLVSGQDLTIAKDAVKAAVDAASQLSAAQQASWREYTVLVTL